MKISSEILPGWKLEVLMGGGGRKRLYYGRMAEPPIVDRKRCHAIILLATTLCRNIYFAISSLAYATASSLVSKTFNSVLNGELRDIRL